MRRNLPQVEIDILRKNFSYDEEFGRKGYFEVSLNKTMDDEVSGRPFSAIFTDAIIAWTDRIPQKQVKFLHHKSRITPGWKSYHPHRCVLK